MAHRIKVTGYIEIEDHEYDSGDLGPLTEDAWTSLMTGTLSILDDAEFEEADES